MPCGIALGWVRSRFPCPSAIGLRCVLDATGVTDERTLRLYSFSYFNFMCEPPGSIHQSQRIKKPIYIVISVRHIFANRLQFSKKSQSISYLTTLSTCSMFKHFVERINALIDIYAHRCQNRFPISLYPFAS